MKTAMDCKHLLYEERLENQIKKLQSENDLLRSTRADLIAEVVRLRRALYYADRLRLHTALRTAA